MHMQLLRCMCNISMCIILTNIVLLRDLINLSILRHVSVLFPSLFYMYLFFTDWMSKCHLYCYYQL